MISDKCSFADFLKAVKGLDGTEIIHTTNQEATRAQRLCFRGYRDNSGNAHCCDDYSKKLKGFILFLRHGVKVSCIKDADLRGFKRIC